MLGASPIGHDATRMPSPRPRRSADEAFCATFREVMDRIATSATTMYDVLYNKRPQNLVEEMRPVGDSPSIPSSAEHPLPPPLQHIDLAALHMNDFMAFVSKYGGEEPYVGPYAEMEVSRSSRRIPSLTIAHS